MQERPMCRAYFINKDFVEFSHSYTFDEVIDRTAGGKRQDDTGCADDFI